METIYPRRFGVFYDFRNPAAWRQPWPERYRQLIDQIAWVDAELEFDEISISEHHFLDDGWTPSPLVLAAAVASRTSRVGIATNIIQLPLHQPLRIAEDALTVDILSQGRFRLGVAAGYREEEFAGLGVRLGDRGSLMDEGIAIIRKAFAGEPFAFSGRHWSFPELTVAPGPMRPGGPEIWLGGRARPALERAAAQGDGFMASSNDDVTGYLAARRQLGFKDAPAKTMRTARLIIDEDPERALEELSEHMLFHVNEYIEYGFVKRPRYTDARDLIRDGQFDIVDAEGALDRLRTAGAAGVHEFHVYGVLPGEPLDSGSRRLDYISNKVLPTLRLGWSAPVARHEEEGTNVE